MNRFPWLNYKPNHSSSALVIWMRGRCQCTCADVNLALDAYQYLSLCVKRNCLSPPRLPGALCSNLSCNPTGTALGGDVCPVGLEEACPLAALPPDAPSGHVSLPTACPKPEPEACLGDFLLPVLVILVDRAGIGVSFFNFLLRNIERDFSLHLVFVLLNTKRQRTWSQDSVRSRGRDMGLGGGRGAGLGTQPPAPVTSRSEQGALRMVRKMQNKVQTRQM